MVGIYFIVCNGIKSKSNNTKQSCQRSHFFYVDVDIDIDIGSGSK